MSEESVSAEILEGESNDWMTEAREQLVLANQLHYAWKVFERSQSNLIKSFIGLCICNSIDTDEFNLESVFEKCSDEQKNIINSIVDQLQFNDDSICLAVTILRLSNGYPSVLFRQARPNDEVNFIDLKGRVYTCWEDFVKTNELPKGGYLAPRGGIHEVNGEIHFYTSPADGKISQIRPYCDIAASIGTLGSIGLGVFAVCPVTAMVMGAGGTVWYCGNSAFTLLDRYQHRQSVALNNLESISAWSNIGLSTVNGISTITLKNAEKILKQCGKYSGWAEKALKGLNYTTMIGCSFNFGFSLYCTQEKFRRGELSTLDCVGLCVSAFLLYGAVVNCRQMDKFLSDLRENPRAELKPPEGISKSARRRWRKAQLKKLTDNSSMVKVDSSDFAASEFINVLLVQFSKEVLGDNPSLRKMYFAVASIVQDILDYTSLKTNLSIFVGNLFSHVRNLRQIIKNDFDEMKSEVVRILQWLGINVSSQSTDEISRVTHNGLLSINDTEDDVVSADESMNNGSSPINAAVDDVVVANKSSPSSRAKTEYEVIFDLLKRRIGRRWVTTSEELLLIFMEELSFLTDEIISKINQQYDHLVSSNIQAIGNEEKAKLLLSKVGVNSKYDFANKAFSKTVESLNVGDELNAAIFPEDETNKIFDLYRELFLTVNETDISVTGALETCEILKNSVEIVIQPLIKHHDNSKQLYENNVPYLGHKDTTTIVLGALNLENVSINEEQLDRSMFIDLAIKKLNIFEIAVELLAVSKKENESVNETLNNVNNFTKEYKISELLSLCNYYVQKMNFMMENSDETEEERIKKIYSFVTEKFTECFQSEEDEQNKKHKSVSENLKLNDVFIGEGSSTCMIKFLNKANKQDIFDRLMKMFKNEDFAVETIIEYFEKMQNIRDLGVELYKPFLADDGITLFMKDFPERHNEKIFKLQAANLFAMNECDFEVVNCNQNVVLRSNDKFVVFQFCDDGNTALIMKVDLSIVKEIDEDSFPQC